MPRRSAKDSFEIPAQALTLVSPATVKIYRGFLNKLKDQGFNNINDLMTRADECIAAIKKMGLTDKQLYQMSFAVFWVLKGTGYTLSANPYYKFFQTLKSDDNPTKVSFS